MCTAISCRLGGHYFGRNLDLERGYGECVVVTPRNFPLAFRFVAGPSQRYAMIGTAAVVDNYPLYFEATNEMGLSMAALNFPESAAYGACASGQKSIAPFELIPFVLSTCASVEEAGKCLDGIEIVDCNFSKSLCATPLHWILADKNASMTVECTKCGLRVYENPFGVLTNEPPFPFHVANVNRYMSLHEGLATNRLSPDLPLINHSLGLGAVGLPGDFSSASRFVRAVFVKEKSVCDGSEAASVAQFFHILRAVAMPRGCVLTAKGEYEYTRYTSCCNTDTGVYYYTTYDDLSVRQVPLRDADLDGNDLRVYPMNN